MSVSAALLAQVLEASARGESLIAVGADKRPWYSWKAFQTKPASTEQLERWGQEERTTGYAVVTGAVSKLVVIDLDGDEGRALLERLELEPHVRTGRGGYHVRLAHPGFKVATQNSKVTKLLEACWPGLDIRADGGYAIEFGSSEHGDYRHLRPLDELDSVSVLPYELAATLGLLGPEALHDLEAPELGSTAPRQANGRIGQGHRHRRLVEVGGAMVSRGEPYEAVLAEFRRINAEEFEPPHNDSKLIETAADLATRYATSASSRASSKAEEPPALGGHHNRHRVTTEASDRDVVTGVTAPLGVIRTGDELMRQNFAALTWHVPNVIPEGFTLLVGSPKIGKSWLVQHFALALVTGGVVFGEQLERRPVLHLALEDSERRLQARARTLLELTAPDLAAWHYLTHLPPDQPPEELIHGWLERHRDGPPPAVVIDTYGRVRGARSRDESPYTHDYRVGVALKAIADAVPGVALVAVHHDRKALSQDFVEDVSGTNGVAGSADTIAVVRRERTKPEGVLLVTGRDVNEAAYAVRFEHGRWSRDGESWETAQDSAAATAASLGRGDLAGGIVGWLVEHGPGSPAVIAVGLGEDREAVRQSLVRMHQSGVLVRPKRGRYSLPGQDGET